jgi:hypothetical protein
MLAVCKITHVGGSLPKSRDPNGHVRGAAVQSRRARVDFVTAGERSGRRSVPALI